MEKLLIESKRLGLSQDCDGSTKQPTSKFSNSAASKRGKAEPIKQLKEAVRSNKQLWGNILLENRVFARVHNRYPEYLISLNNVTIKPHYWGHIFWHEGRYVSCIVALDYWHNAARKNLFDLYHYNLEVLGHWYPASGDTLSFSSSIAMAVDQMATMIRDFTVEQPFATCNYLITQIYPFPNVFKEWVSFEQWRISKG